MSVPDYYKLLNEAKELGEVAVGPFYGEFGHFLIHVKPFLGYLHSLGIKIHYCGHGNQKSICIDNKGNPLAYDYFMLPEHFDVSVPEMNDPRFVKDKTVLALADGWLDSVKGSDYPLFDLSDPHNYRFQWWPWWYNNRFGKLYNIGKHFNPNREFEHAVAIYSRTKPIGTAQGDGPEFDINKIIDIVSKHVDIVYVVGHPDQAEQIYNKYAVNIITNDNAEIMRHVSKCKVVLAHNSGAAYVAKMLRIPGVIFHNGELRRFQWTEYCSERWSKSPLYRAEDYGAIEQELKKLL